ncbi:MAG TPA: DUF4126 domain-containing protein [Dissulfurispiraceae bacterium]|nr:DUF4126 domain-containing protein [Dissulfurispiraceae bacterium]
MDTLLGLFIGIGLSAACGFRVFVPLLITSVAAQGGHLTLSSGFDWIGTSPAVIAFATATVLEIAAYYTPWLDHLLDSITTPAAAIAGTIITASLVGDLSPFLKWSLAIIAGGGTAAAVQAGTVMTRSASLMTTGGLGNGLVATAELFGSAVVSFLALFLPVVVIIMVVLVLAFLIRRIAGRKKIPAQLGQTRMLP